jgi:hypothetical protein
MLHDSCRGEGTQEAGESPARSRHCNRGANPSFMSHCRRQNQVVGRLGVSRDPGVRRLAYAR